MLTLASYLLVLDTSSQSLRVWMQHAISGEQRTEVYR